MQYTQQREEPQKVVASNPKASLNIGTDFLVTAEVEGDINPSEVFYALANVLNQYEKNDILRIVEVKPHDFQSGYKGQSLWFDILLRRVNMHKRDLRSVAQAMTHESVPQVDRPSPRRSD